MTSTADDRFVSRLLDALPDVGYTGRPVGTGGGCEAVEVIYSADGSHLLVTDGDAGLRFTQPGPDGLGAYVGDYPASLDGEPFDMAWITDPTPARLAEVVGVYLNTGEYPTAPDVVPLPC